MQIQLRPEIPADIEAIRHVHRAAFAGDAEAQLVDELRAAGLAPISLVALVADQLVGHVLFSRLHVQTSAERLAGLALAPVGVLPDYQRQGIGGQLIRAGHHLATSAGERFVIVLGHASYYPRFGYSPQLALPLAAPWSGPSFMALELVPGALADVSGQVQYAAPFLRL